MKVAVLEVLQRLRHRFGAWLIVLTCIPAVLVVVRLIKILSTRITFPMELEWNEGGQLLHVHRFLHGMGLYVEPYQGFTPFSYPPGHTVVLAIVSAVLGVDFWVGRAVSCAATAVAMALLAREVYREFRPVGFPVVWAVFAIGTMAAAFPITGGWFDLIRNDEVALALALGAAVTSFELRTAGRARFVLSAALMTAAIFTKQTCVFYVTWMLLFQLVRSPKRALLLGALVACLGAATTLFLQFTTDGRYLEYTVTLLAKQPVHRHMYADALRRWVEFAPYLPLLPIALFVLAWFNLLTARALYWSGMLAAAFPAAMLPYAKQGGYINNMLPVAFLAGPVALCLAGSLLKHSARESRFGKSLALTLAAATGLYLDARQIPERGFIVTPRHRAAADRLLSKLRSLDGSLLALHNPFLAIKTGSRIEQLHEMPWVDAWIAGVPNLDMRPFLRRTQPKYVLLTWGEIELIHTALTNKYVVDLALPEGMLVPPLTGAPNYPRFLMRRYEPSPTQTCVFNFERGHRDWKATGEAFDSSPSSTGIYGQVLVGRGGHSAASSIHPRLRHAATGTLTSPTFEIDRPRLTLHVGGSKSARVGVELLIDGDSVAQARGYNVDLLEVVTWDVSRYRGKEARIRIFDQETAEWGYIFVDEICLDG